jgi:hypothetical protein
MRSNLFKSIILSVAVLSTSIHASDISQQDINDGVAALMGTKSVKVTTNTKKGTEDPTTRAGVKLRLSEALNSHLRASKNTKLKGESGAYFLYNSQLKKDMAFTILVSIKKKFHSNIAFYQDSSLGSVFDSSTISKEWGDYVNETNGFKKRKALKILDVTFKNQINSMTKPHSGNYIFSYRSSGSYPFDFDEMSKTVVFNTIGSSRISGVYDYFDLLRDNDLKRKNEDKGSRRTSYGIEVADKRERYKTTYVRNIGGGIPTRTTIGGKFIEALSPTGEAIKIYFDNEAEAERFENIAMDGNDEIYLQVQMYLSFIDSISSFVFTPIAVEMKSANKNIAMSKVFSIDKTSTPIDKSQLVNKKLSDILPLNKISKIRKVDTSSNIQLFDEGNTLYYLISHHGSSSKIHSGDKDITVSGMLAKYKYLGVLKGDYAVWSFDSLSKNNIDKGSVTSIGNAAGYLALKVIDGKVLLYKNRSAIAGIDSWLSKFRGSNLGARYAGDLSSGDATMLGDAPTLKAKPKVDVTKAQPNVEFKTNETPSKAKQTASRVANNTLESPSKAKLTVSKVVKNTPKTPVAKTLVKNDKLSISCDLAIKDTGGFFNGQHIVGTQITDVPREYLLNRIPQVLKSEGFVATTGEDANTLYYIEPQVSGKNYNHDVTFTDSGFSFEFRTYAGVAVSTSAVKSYFCDLIAKV